MIPIQNQNWYDDAAITQVTTSCGCLIVDMYPATLARGIIGSYYAPGDPAEVLTCPQVMRHGDRLSHGPEQLRIHTSDGSVRRLERRDMNLGVLMSRIFDGDPEVDPVPVVTTHKGSLGVDVR